MKRRSDLEIISGRVAADGTAVAGGDYFQSHKTATGVYELWFPRGFRLITVVPSLTLASGLVYVSGYNSENGCVVNTQNVSQLGTDIAFGFIATGMQV